MRWTVPVTDPGSAAWSPPSGPHRAATASALIGSGDAVWARAADDLLHWRVKTRSGFHVPPARVRAGARTLVTALAGLVVEPVEVVAVVEEADRVGFAYRTLPGHPVDGEEAFVVSREGDDVRLTVRSLTRAAPQQPWRALFPVLLVAQRVVRRRYLRALRF